MDVLASKMNSPLNEVIWSDVRDDIKRANPELASLIDDINPDNSYRFIKARYQFGDLIVKNGVLQFPYGDKIVPLNKAETVSDQAYRHLSYSPIPLSLILGKSCEIFVHNGDRAIPLNTISSGSLFGTFETLDCLFGKQSKPVWDVSAGAISILMLPKITEVAGIKRLRFHYDLPQSVRIKQAVDHWEAFRRIARHHNFTQPWEITILFFTKKWVSHLHDPSWAEFYQYVFKQGWEQSQYAIDKISFGLFWQQFVKALNRRNIKATAYLSDTIKHLFLIATDGAPAFIPDDHSQLLAPTMGLKQAFVEVYGLKKHLPTILYSSLLSSRQQPNKTGYYSLSMPTLLEGYPEDKVNFTIMMALKNIKLMINTLLHSEKSQITLIDRVLFEYFHVEPDKYHETMQSDLVPMQDSAFLVDHNNYPDRQFCDTSSFWRGCIRISRQN